MRNIFESFHALTPRDDKGMSILIKIFAVSSPPTAQGEPSNIFLTQHICVRKKKNLKKGLVFVLLCSLILLILCYVFQRNSRERGGEAA